MLEIAFPRTVNLLLCTDTGTGSANAGSRGVLGAALTPDSAKIAVFCAGNSILLPGSVGGQHPSPSAERCAGTDLFRQSKAHAYSTAPALLQPEQHKAISHAERTAVLQAADLQGRQAVLWNLLCLVTRCGAAPLSAVPLGKSVFYDSK